MIGDCDDAELLARRGLSAVLLLAALYVVVVAGFVRAVAAGPLP